MGEGQSTVRIYILTDQEGVAGVVNADDYEAPGARYYEVARELTTLEVNAAIDGARASGAKEFLVVDGHGHGSIDIRLLDRAARLLTGSPIGRELGLDASFDAAFIIGQHARSNTDGGHLSHTLSFAQEDYRINGRSFGEIGRNFLLAAYFGVPVVFLSGDQAACDEARDLVPNIEVAPVKEGVTSGSASGLSTRENRHFNGAAVHLQPESARDLIRERAKRAIIRAEEIKLFWLEPPYELVSTLRPDTVDGERRVATSRSHDYLELLKLPLDYAPAERAIQAGAIG